MIVTVANIKGGSGKTTTAIGIASALRENNTSDVLFIDSDKQGTGLRWAETANLPFLSIAIPTTAIHTKINDFNNKHIVIDTPPGDIGVVYSAIKASEIVVIPIKPTPTDIDQLPETIAAIEDMKVFNPNIKYFVLLNMLIKRTVAASNTQAMLKKQKRPVLSTFIPQLQSAALSFGKSPFDIELYKKIIDEIKGEIENAK